MSKPLLIRISSAYNKLHELDKKPSFTKDILMSNPAFIINLNYLTGAQAPVIISA